MKSQLKKFSKLIKDINYFKEIENINEILTQCNNTVSCVLEKILSKVCYSSLKENKNRVTDFLLGIDRNFFSLQEIDFDPASFLHHLNKRSLKKMSPKRKGDKNRHSACESFKVN